MKSYNVQVWVGLREQYTDKVHTIEDVYKICDHWCLSGDCVTVTETSFRYKGGNEPGVVIGYIQYPGFPRKRRAILNRAKGLAFKMMLALDQCKITITTPYKTYMLENPQV